MHLYAISFTLSANIKFRESSIKRHGDAGTRVPLFFFFLFKIPQGLKYAIKFTIENRGGCNLYCDLLFRKFD